MDAAGAVRLWSESSSVRIAVTPRPHDTPRTAMNARANEEARATGVSRDGVPNLEQRVYPPLLARDRALRDPAVRLGTPEARCRHDATHAYRNGHPRLHRGTRRRTLRRRYPTRRRELSGVRPADAAATDPVDLPDQGGSGARERCTRTARPGRRTSHCGGG